RQLTVGTYRVRLIAHPQIKGPTGNAMALTGLKSGMLVKAEGIYVKDAGFTARKVNDESTETVKKPELAKRVRVQGKIERTDPSRHTITVMGTTFIVPEKVRVISEAKE